MRQIKKRDNRVIDFDVAKIIRAMEKAFAACNVEISAEKLKDMTDMIVLEMDRKYPEQIPSVENVQNIVEFQIMTEGFYNVARSYIIYRYEHTKVREEEKKEVLK